MHAYPERPRRPHRGRPEVHEPGPGVSGLVHLQRSAGNAAVTSLLSGRGWVQRMTVVGEDEEEGEDRERTKRTVDLTKLDRATLEAMRDAMVRRRLATFTVGGVTYQPARGDFGRVEAALAALTRTNWGRGALRDERRAPPKRERSAEQDRELGDDRGGKRTRTAGDEGEAGPSAPHEGTVTPELLAWMESRTSQKTAYGRGVGPAKVRQVKKDDIKMACWNWATEALSEDAEPSHGNFWNVLHGEVSDAPWYTELTQAVQEQVTALTASLERDKLKINPFVPQKDIDEGTREGQQRIGAAAQHLRTGAELFVTVHGLTVVPEAQAAAWVVCQYRRREGAAVPEHWWIELRGTSGPVIIQTVPDVPLEIGGPELRWHSDTSARGRNSEASEYEMIRIPIKALKGRHVEILRQGMEGELGGRRS